MDSNPNELGKVSKINGSNLNGAKRNESEVFLFITLGNESEQEERNDMEWIGSNLFWYVNETKRNEME